MGASSAYRIEFPVRVAMAALALGGFGIGTTEFVAMGLLPEMAAGVGVSEPTAGHVISAYALGVVVGAPTFAALGSRMGRRTLLIALMTMFALGNLATVLAPTYAWLIVARFAAGLPHGAYFGVASLVAAHLAGPGRRARAVATVMMGLSVANVVGVPAASWIGQNLGWRSAFVVVVVVAVCTVLALRVYLPELGDLHVSNPLTELGAFGNRQVQLTLLFATVGFGGMFAVYTYISSTLTEVSGLPRSAVPAALMLYGVGMVLGNALGGRIADRAPGRGLVVSTVALIASLAMFVVAARSPYLALPVLFVVAVSASSMVPALQTRLMDVAGDAQTLAATLNHAALNMANAAGAWIGGAVIAAGYGYTAPAAAGIVLAAIGLVILLVALSVDRTAQRPRVDVEVSA